MMNADILSYYDNEVIRMIVEKYGIPQKKAVNKFLLSESYRMLIDPELEMQEFSPSGIFDMWESEQITGDPRNSLYLRRDEYV